MKITLPTVTVVSAILLLTGIGIVNAVPAKPVLPSSSPTPQNSQQAETFDLPLLKKVFAQFFLSDRYLTESQFLFRSSGRGINVELGIQLKTITQTGNKFRTEISFNKPGETPKINAIVTSDGNRVTTYRPDLKQYAVIPFAKFEDSMWVGLSTIFFSTVSEDDRSALAQGLQDEKFLKEILKEMNLSDIREIKGARSSIPEENSYMYEYAYTESNTPVTARVFVDLASASVKQIQFISKEKNLDFEFTEKILRRTPNPSITSQTFRFTPPKTAKRVKTLSIFPDL
jgi:outer membrane lipoprotein-sorting protein